MAKKQKKTSYYLIYNNYNDNTAGYITDEYPLNYAIQRLNTMKRDNDVSRVRLFERKTVDKQIDEFSKVVSTNYRDCAEDAGLVVADASRR